MTPRISILHYPILVGQTAWVAGRYAWVAGRYAWFCAKAAIVGKMGMGVVRFYYGGDDLSLMVSAIGKVTDLFSAPPIRVASNIAKQALEIAIRHQYSYLSEKSSDMTSIVSSYFSGFIDDNPYAVAIIPTKTVPLTLGGLLLPCIVCWYTSKSAAFYAGEVYRNIAALPQHIFSRALSFQALTDGSQQQSTYGLIKGIALNSIYASLWGAWAYISEQGIEEALKKSPEYAQYASMVPVAIVAFPILTSMVQKTAAAFPILTNMVRKTAAALTTEQQVDNPKSRSAGEVRTTNNSNQPSSPDDFQKTIEMVRIAINEADAKIKENRRRMRIEGGKEGRE